jgi:iron complex outermembrane recepter protein
MKILCGVLTVATGLVLAEAGHAQHADLEEIVVYANPLNKSALDLAQSAVVLAGDDLTLSVTGSLGESLASVPGVTASYFGPKASRPIIRGLSGERVLMLLDGVSALDVSNLSPDHSVGIEPILADQIEILKGPSTLLFGSGAVGGVVNVIDGRIPRRELEGLNGSAELRGDSASGEFSAAGRFDARAGDFGLHLAAYDRSTDDIEIPGYAWSRTARDEALLAGEEPDLTRGKVRNSDSDTTGGAVGASWIRDNLLVGVAWSRHETNYGLPGPGEEEHAEEGEGSPAAGLITGLAAEEEVAIRIDQEQDRFDFKAHWTAESGFIRDVLVRAAYSDYEHAELEGTEVGTLFEQTGLDTRLHLGHAAVAGWSGTVGLQYNNQDLDAFGAEAYVPPSTTSALSAFVIEQRTFGALAADVGLRIEKQEIDTVPGLGDYSDTAFTLAAGLLWSFSDTLSAAAHLTRSERHPQAAELYADGPHLAVQRFEIGDPDLRTETANTVDIGLRSEAGVHWHASLFYSDFGDYIYAAPTAAQEDGLPVFQYVQADASFYGIEVEVEVPLVERDDRSLALRLGGDYVRGELDRGGNLPQMPPLRLLTALEYDAGALHAAIDLQWFDDQDRTAANESSTDGGTQLGAEVSWRWSRWDPGVLLFARGTNLLDEELRRHPSPLKDYVPLPGRSLSLGVRVGF